MRVERLAVVAEVFGAIYTAEPLAADPLHTAITQCGRVTQ